MNYIQCISSICTLLYRRADSIIKSVLALFLVVAWQPEFQVLHLRNERVGHDNPIGLCLLWHSLIYNLNDFESDIYINVCLPTAFLIFIFF